MRQTMSEWHGVRKPWHGGFTTCDPFLICLLVRTRRPVRQFWPIGALASEGVPDAITTAFREQYGSSHYDKLLNSVCALAVEIAPAMHRVAERKAKRMVKGNATGSRASGTNPRVMGTNPKTLGISPKQLGTNPRALGTSSRQLGISPRQLSVSPKQLVKQTKKS